MTKSSVELKKCAKNAYAGADRTSPTISRRGFLGSSALVVLPALCGGCSNSSEPPVVDLPAVANNQIAIHLADFPDLTKVGGSIVGKASGYRNPIAIVQVTANQFAAVDAICTHMNCTVAYSALNVEFECPCHGSTYEVTGTVINGPAVLPLTTFTVSSDGTTLTVTLS